MPSTADASAGRAQIMCTIHQPSSDICENFDNLILLSCGRMLYCGAWSAADAYFAAAGFECAICPMDLLLADTMHWLQAQRNWLAPFSLDACSVAAMRPETVRLPRLCMHVSFLLKLHLPCREGVRVK